MLSVKWLQFCLSLSVLTCQDKISYSYILLDYTIVSDVYGCECVPESFLWAGVQESVMWNKEVVPLGWMFKDCLGLQVLVQI